MQSYIGYICLAFLHCAFSNVSSNGLPEKMQSHTGCICSTFLHCAFSNVSSTFLYKKMHSYIGCTCVFRCVLNLRWYEVPLVASVLLFSIVRFQMSPQHVCPRRCKVTLVAFVWLFSIVRFQIGPQIACLRRCKVTLVALFWPISAMCFKMSPQMAYLRRCIVALIVFVSVFHKPFHISIPHSHTWIKIWKRMFHFEISTRCSFCCS